MKYFKEKKEERLKNEEKIINECKKIKEKLEKITIDFKLNSSNEGKVFGSVSSKAICDELKKKDLTLIRKK